MKTLYLVRHAKSSWNDASLADFDRPLNSRGERDAPVMGQRLKENRILPDLLISSPARRAILTARAIAEALDYPSETIRALDVLYHASPPTLLQVVQDTLPSAKSLMLVGHNPGLTAFANVLCAEGVDNIVTTGVYALQWKTESWQEIRTNQEARLLFYDYPKRNTETGNWTPEKDA